MTPPAPRRPAPTDADPFRRLVAIMERLLDPDGCPWDREQDHRTLRPYVIEEAYEVCEAIDAEDWGELRAELGDLGLQIVFHAALARRAGRFDVNDVYEAICAKLVRRHPHVFGELEVGDSGTVLRNWEAIKRAERAEKKDADAPPPSHLDGVPVAMPALQRAQRLQAKAARVGFDWKDIGPVWAKVAEEIGELRAEADAAAPRERLEDELGDLLFATVNLARFLKVDPEQALQATNAKFARRFRHIEARAHEAGVEMQAMTLEQLDAWWDEAKRLERGQA